MIKPKFKLNNSYSSPENLDYDILGLHKKRVLLKGELILVEYYKNFNGSIYTDLYVSEARVYNRNQYDLVSTRDMTIKFYLEDDSLGCEKKTQKYYTFQEAYEEGKYRRTNIINDASLGYPTGLFFQVGQANATDFLNGIDAEIGLFIKGSKQPLIDAVTNSTKAYMTQAVKDAILLILNM